VSLFVCYIRARNQGPWLHCSHLGILYALFSRSSNCSREMSPRPTRRERSKRREGEIKWAIKNSREFCLNAEFHVTFKDLLHAVNLRHGTVGFTSPPKECALGIFFALKNPTASTEFQPANLGSRGQHASSRQPKPLSDLVSFVWNKTAAVECHTNYNRF
jgi:hypothetical protein